MESVERRNYRANRLAYEYSKIFPNISFEDHLMIINGAINTPAYSLERQAMSVKGFISWYTEIGAKLHERKDLIEEIRKNPHFAMYKEAMILDDDWCEESILEKITKISKALAN